MPGSWLLKSVGQVCSSLIPPSCPGGDLTKCEHVTIDEDGDAVHTAAGGTTVYSQGRYNHFAPLQWWVGPSVDEAECQRICKEDLADWGCKFISYDQRGYANPRCWVHQVGG